MPIKPNENTVLDTYTFSELMNLAQKKALQEKEEHTSKIRQYLSAIDSTLSPSVQKRVGVRPNTNPGVGVRRGRPRKVDAKPVNIVQQATLEESSQDTQATLLESETPMQPTTPLNSPDLKSQIKTAISSEEYVSMVTSSDDDEPRKTIAEYLLEAVTDSPATVDELTQKMLAAGMKTSALDPKKVVVLEVGKQFKKGTIQRADRGLYYK